MRKEIDKTEKDILNGKYRDHYLIYNRKSTDEPDNQKNSISYQKAENGKLAIREQLRIAPVSIKSFCVGGIVSERHSGFKEDNNIFITKNGMVQYRIERPKFQRLLQYLSQGLFKGVICFCWDRISRNKSDDALIRKLMRKGIDIQFAYAKYDKTSSGALHMDIDGMFAEHHSRVTSEKVSIATRNSREQGICTYRAPIGYLNIGDMKNKPFDPVRAPIIKKLFEMYSTGDWSLNDLAHYANNQGLTTVPMRRRRTEEEMLAEEDEDVKIEKVERPMNNNLIHKIFTNRFYTGRIINSEGTYIRSASHKPLISDELFEKVRQELKKKKVSTRYTDKIELPFRALIRCDHCGRVYTPYIKKGIQYFGARCFRDCENTKRSFNLDFIEDKIGQLIQNLYFTKDELIEIDARCNTDISLLEEKRHNEFEKNDRQKRKLREELKYLRTNKLVLIKSGVYTPECYVEEENKLSSQILSLQTEEQISDQSMHEMVLEIVKLSELLENVYLYYQNANSEEKEKIIKIIFSELTLSGNILKYQCRNGFKPFQSRFLVVCEPTTWLSELLEYREEVVLVIKDLDLS